MLFFFFHFEERTIGFLPVQQAETTARQVWQWSVLCGCWQAWPACCSSTGDHRRVFWRLGSHDSLQPGWREAGTAPQPGEGTACWQLTRSCCCCRKTWKKKLNEFGAAAGNSSCSRWWGAPPCSWSWPPWLLSTDRPQSRHVKGCTFKSKHWYMIQGPALNGWIDLGRHTCPRVATTSLWLREKGCFFSVITIVIIREECVEEGRKKVF